MYIRWMNLILRYYNRNDMRPRSRGNYYKYHYWFSATYQQVTVILYGRRYPVALSWVYVFIPLTFLARDGIC